MPSNSTTHPLPSLTGTTPIGTAVTIPPNPTGRPASDGIIPAPLRHLCAAALRDYAAVVVLQASLRTPPSDVHRAYEGIYGSPLDVETLAEDLRLLASTIDVVGG